MIVFFIVSIFLFVLLLFSFLELLDYSSYTLGTKVKIIGGKYEGLTGTVLVEDKSSKSRTVSFDYSYDLQRIEPSASIPTKYLQVIPEERAKGDRF